MKTFETILREVDSATEYVRSQGGVLLDNSVETQAHVGKLFMELSDEDYLDWDDELPPTSPNAIRASTLQEFLMVYEALGHVHGGEVDPRLVKKDVTHEAGHMKVSRYLGFGQSTYELQITTSQCVRKLGHYGVTFGWRPMVRQADPRSGLTKLAAASLVARPLSLSDGDKARLLSMGYKGLQHEVAERILKATDPQLSSLPLPEGF